MILYPAIDLYDGKVVKMDPRGGHARVEKVYGGPAELARRWGGEGAEWLHVVDLDGALGTGRDNRAALDEVLGARGGVRVQFGGGIRDEEAIRALPAAVERVVIGTKAVRDAKWLQHVAGRFPGRLVVSIDGRGRDVLVGGWQESAGVDVVDFLGDMKGIPVAAFLYTNVAVEGRSKGVDWEPVKAVLDAAPAPVVFSGGVTTLEEVARFKSLGAFGIICGSALYSGRFTFADGRAAAS